MQIFLTGGTGYIGHAALRACIAAGHDVTAPVRNEPGARRVTDAGANPLLGDMCQPDTWMAQATDADTFIHLACSFDDDMRITEPRLINSLLTHANSRATPLRFLYTGGCWLYGQTGNAVATEASPLSPISAFGWAAEAITTLQDQPNLNTAVLHPAMVYDEQGGAFSRMLTALRAGRPAPIWGSEHTRWPLVHREDTAAAYVKCAEAADTGSFNIVSQTGVATGEIARVLAQQAGIKTKPAVLPRKWTLMRHGVWAEGPMLDQQMASTRMHDLGWSPQYRDFSTLDYGF